MQINYRFFVAQYTRKVLIVTNGAFICFAESDGLSLAKAAKLPMMVENEVKKISDMRKELKKEEGHYRKLVLNYQKVFLVDSFSFLLTHVWIEFMSIYSVNFKLNQKTY